MLGRDTVLAALPLLLLMPLPARPEATAEPPQAIHGMLLLGREQLYASHLPMFHPAHAWQAIATVRLPPDAEATVRRLRADDDHREADRLLTLAPTTRWRLPEGFVAGNRFPADLHAGHFERGGSLLLPEVEVEIVAVLHFSPLHAGATPSEGAWLVFGSASDRYAAHRIGGAPGFDQLLRLLDGALVEPGVVAGPARPLAADDRLAGSRLRVLYTEHDDLASP